MTRKRVKPMMRLTDKQLEQKADWIDNYIGSKNAATGSIVDANANVGCKNIATMNSEMWKDSFIQMGRYYMQNKISELFGQELAQQYIDDIESHAIYQNDATNPFSPYCAAISMYPLIDKGMVPLGGVSKAPKHLASYCGSYINMTFAISAQLSGALATSEFLLYFHYFAVKDYGTDYLTTHAKEIEAQMQSVIYTINQPAASRGNQSCFTNLSVFDRYYFESLFGTFHFPDGTQVSYDEYDKLQRWFVSWFRQERGRALLSFPVLTEASLNEDNKPKDENWARFIAKERSLGTSMFSYNSEDASALSSCCRLRNILVDNDFAFSLGGTGVDTGSIRVITINMNRVVQKEYNLDELLDRVHKYLYAARKLIEDLQSQGMITIYDAGFIRMDKQYLTVGINGFNEAAEFKDIVVSNNPDYINYMVEILSKFGDANKKWAKEFGVRFNTEAIPAESVSVKNAAWDKKDGLKVNRDCYSSYFYLPEDQNLTIPDIFKLHGREITEHLTGGTAAHINLEKVYDEDFYYWLRCLAAETGCFYWCNNTPQGCCNDCEHLEFVPFDVCPECGSTNTTGITRVIGYHRKITDFSEDRQKEAMKRVYH